jgi:hypothetical protein
MPHGSLTSRRCGIAATRAPAAMLVLMLMGGCCHRAEAERPARERQECALGVPPAPAWPRLFRALREPPANASYAPRAICAKPHALADECELVDDLQALLGNGYDCDDGVDAPIGACKGWAAQSRVAADAAPPPCGAAACSNVALELRDPSGARVRATFYDDPSCHAPPREPNCPKTGRACYYRILRVEPA